MVNVHLHGPLAKEFGKVWCLDIAAPIEAIQAIAVTRPEIKDRILEMHRRGLVFRVRSKYHDYDNDDVGMTLGDIARIDIIPIIKGAGPGVRAVVGTIMVYAGYALSATPFGVPLMAAGASLIMGAITEWLTPIPTKDSIRNLQSWTLGGPSGTVDQGMPVPIIYGEVLTGGYPISGGVAASDVAPDGSIGASVSVGGNFEEIVYVVDPGTYTVRTRYSAGSLNIGEPLTYQWSFSGLPSSIRVTGENSATVTVEADFTVGPLEKVAISGTASVTVTGKKLDGSGGTISPTASVPVTLGVTSVPPPNYNYNTSEG